MASKKKGTPPEMPPKRLVDMSLSDVARMNLDAIRSGDPGKLISTLEDAIEPDPEPEPPMRFAITLPLMSRDGLPSVGASCTIGYGGVGTELSITTPDGATFVVNLMRLAVIVDALRSAMFSAGPMPPPPRPILRPR
jgi:hypothetical protein